MLKKLTPNLMVNNVNRSIAFYQEVLGFERLMTVPEEGEFDWALLKCGEVEIMLQSRGSLTQEIPALAGQARGGALTLYIDVVDVEGLYEKIRDRVTLVQALHGTFYGTREFAIQDEDGFILAFAEREAD